MAESFQIVDMKDYAIAEKIQLDIQVNYVFRKPKIKNAEAEKNFKMTEFKFMVDLKFFMVGEIEKSLKIYFRDLFLCMLVNNNLS